MKSSSAWRKRTHDKAFNMFPDHGDVLKLYSDVRLAVIDEPAADVVEVMRCKDCKYYIDAFNDGYMYCMRPIQGEDYSETGYMFPLELVTGIATTAALKWTKRLVKSDGEQV